MTGWILAYGLGAMVTTGAVWLHRDPRVPACDELALALTLGVLWPLVAVVLAVFGLAFGLYALVWLIDAHTARYASRLDTEGVKTDE